MLCLRWCCRVCSNVLLSQADEHVMAWKSLHEMPDPHSSWAASREAAATQRCHAAAQTVCSTCHHCKGNRSSAAPPLVLLKVYNCSGCCTVLTR